MMNSFEKFRRFALHRNDAKEKREFLPPAHLDELAQAAQDMQEMRNCYDSLLSAAAATANSAYEFSESLREMGNCLLEKTTLHDDEESSRILLMLGKVQFELQKLVDSYRGHIFLTITNPSESLLNELRTVEEMKIQCDEKRDVYKYMIAQQREKGKSKSGKGENFTVEQLQAAHDEYDEDATLCVFRLKSLKQGQSRSLLTQAARHHAAQLNFFRRGLKSLEAVEPLVRRVSEQHHIDFQFSGLEEDYGDDGENSYNPNDDGELSFDKRSNKLDGGSMDVDEAGHSFPQPSTENAEMNLDKNQEDLRVSSREPRAGSHSAPIFAEKKFDPAEKIRNMQPSSTRKSNTYVLPKPIDARGSSSSRTSSSVPHSRPSGGTHNLWHSSPLEDKKHEKDSGNGNLSGPTISKSHSVARESDSNDNSTPLPPPLADKLSLPQHDTFNASDTKKFKRQAFSGPLISKPGSTKPVLSASGPIASTELPQLVSGMLSRLPIPQPSSSPKVSPSASPPLVSSPKISELHELPRPPGNFAHKPAKAPDLIGHSAPLAFRNQELSAMNKIPLEASSVASPLPTPPLIVPRSFSIPSSSQRAMAIHVAKLLDSPQVPHKAEEVASPPLTPLSLSNMKPESTVNEVASQFGQIRVNAGGS
uniref:BAR domain-containing protein n=1 Tax=Fagus sylvatica TaxID=28930 RepID=A0A2N9HP41_FAGSY